MHQNINDQSYFIHPRGFCETEHVGSGTRIWAFAHILPGAVIGKNCNICDHVFIEGGVVIGNDVTVKCGVQLWDGLHVGDRVFIGPNATFANDRHPRSKQYPDVYLSTIIEDGASIGANATILPGITVGRGAMVGAGAVVTRDVPPHATVVGNPAVIIGYSTSVEKTSARGPNLASGNNVPPGSKEALDVAGCYLQRLPHFADMRGSLTPLEAVSDIPFSISRIFLVYDVPSNHVRGEHAHRECKQFLIAVKGEISVVVDNGSARQEVKLDSPSVGLYMSPMTWGIQYRFSSDAVLLVAASLPYDADDYIRDYKDFLVECQSKSNSDE